MGEIKQIVEIYIKDSNILEEEAKKISASLEANIQDVIAPGKVGYDTGHLHDSIIGNYTVLSKLAIVDASYHADYGQYWYRWKGGKDFMKQGLKKTLEMYK